MFVVVTIHSKSINRLISVEISERSIFQIKVQTNEFEEWVEFEYAIIHLGP